MQALVKNNFDSYNPDNSYDKKTKLNSSQLNNLYNINYFKKIIELFIKNIIYNKLNNNIKMFDFNFKNNYFDLKINKIVNNII